MRYLGILLLAIPSIVSAHRPAFSDGQHGTVSSAWAVEENDVSIVVYHEVTCGSPQLWMSFDTLGNEDLFFQLGVPVVDRLADYRPSVALLAPGLPALTEPVPFDVPAGLGGRVFHSRAVGQASDFYEPFTQTASWIWIEETVRLVEAGSGYLVAWDPTNSTGKLWVAVGTIEDFSNTTVEDFASWLPRTRSFHETGPSSVEERAPERTCDELESAEMNETSEGPGEMATLDGISEQRSIPVETYDDADAGTGCTTVAADPRPTLALMGMLMAVVITRRRRDRRP